MIKEVLYIFTLIFYARSQFIHEFHIKENTMIYKTILNLNRLLVSENKLEANRSKESKIFMNTVSNRGLFTLDSESNLKVTKQIDREALCPPQTLIKSSSVCGSVEICCHILEFQVSYRNEDVRSFFFKVFIDDENDNRPIFPIVSSPFTSIDENKPVGYKIALPKAQDADSDIFGVLSYKLQTPFIFGNSSDFELGHESKQSTPFLIVAAPLDREKISKYTFSLIASDGVSGNHNTGQTEITINIKDVNDNTPKFERHVYHTTVRENSIPEHLFDITVTDDDEDDNGRLELQLLDNDESMSNRYFTLSITDSTIGRLHAKIRSLVTLDFEDPPNSYEFKLVAKDKGRYPLSSTATVRVQVTNVNDMSPEIHFVQNGKQITSGFAIVEGTPSNVMLAHIQVSDADSQVSQLQCTLTSSNPMLMLEESLFRHPANLYKQYSLRSTQTIDREVLNNGKSDSKIVVVVQCFDHDPERPLSSTGSIFIVISDINDNVPTFSQSSYVGFIDENVINQEISFLPPIFASDKDSALNAKISFYIQDDKNTSDFLFFRIDSDNGRIFNIQPFDFEKKSKYGFLILAKDHGSPVRLSSSSLIIVRVRDKNDNAPKFDRSHYGFSVEENVPIGTLVGTVFATDKDTMAEYKIIRYNIKRDSENRANGYITLDSFTGQIRTRQPIDREKVTTITCIVEVKNPSRTESDLLQEAMVVITVQDINDNPPVFRLIDPSKSRITIFLEVLEHGPVCEPIPIAYEDADDVSKSGSCCDLRLKNDYDKLLFLSKESQSIICVNTVPLRLRNIQVTLIATDRNGNNSLEGEGSFSIVLKNDPNIATKSKAKTPNDNDKKPQHRKEDIRQITLVTILASLAGICLLIIVVIIIISQKRCDRFNLEPEVPRKTNDNASQSMMDLHCNIQRNDLESMQFMDARSTPRDNYYNPMQTMYPLKSIKSAQLRKYDKSNNDFQSDYHHLSLKSNPIRSDDSYQFLHSGMVSCDQLTEYIPSKNITTTTESNPFHYDNSLSMTKISANISNSVNRYNQTSFV